MPHFPSYSTAPAASATTAAPFVPPVSTDSLIDVGLPAKLGVRLYGSRGAAAGAALVVHFHGGAFVAGTLDSGATTAGLLVGAGAVVLSIDYPLAGVHPFPAAIDAGYAAMVWAHRKRARLAGPAARIFVAGEEAGGNLAAAMALMARDRQLPPLAGQILLSPMLDPCLGTASLRRTAAGPVGCPLADGWCQYLCSPAASDHPYATPGRAMRLAGLPPTLLLTADDDPLRDETLAYAGRLWAAHVPVVECVLPAPSGWPGALLDPVRASGVWSEPARSRIHEFLTADRAPRPAGHKPAPSDPL
jgi:acetyl esterase/lipase